MLSRLLPTLIIPLASTAALLLYTSASTAAQPEQASKLWSGDIEFGYVSTSGNTEETTVKSRADINRERGHWRYNIAADTLNSESNDNRSAEKYFIGNRLAYQYTDTNFVFGYLSYDDDRFSGFEYQATAALGLGRRLINKEDMHWDIEVGPGYRVSKVDNSTTGEESEAILRGFTKFIWDFSETANFTQSLNVETGEDNTISKSISALKVQVIDAVSIKLSYTVKYTEQVPTDRKHADTESAVTITYSF